MGTEREKIYYLKCAVILILFAVTVHLSSFLTKERAGLFPANLDRSIGMQLFSEMIGELRTILASYIIIRADMYHHERETRIDWRKDPATLPLHKLVTTLDPHMVQAYDFGAYHLAVNFKKYNEAIKFLLEGIHYNPDSFQLRFTLADIYYIKKEYRTAVKYYLQCLNLADNMIDLKNVFRRLYWSYRYLKEYDSAAKYLRMWAQMSPDEEVIVQLAEQLGELARGEKTEEDFKTKRDADATGKDTHMHEQGEKHNYNNLKSRNNRP